MDDPVFANREGGWMSLTNAKLATTEAHYLQRQTRGPDVRAVLERLDYLRMWRARRDSNP
jgi:hypothetical protein